MTVPTEAVAHEQILLNIIRTLPEERVVHILDFARSIQTQTLADVAAGDEDESEEAIAADESSWDAQFAATQDGLQRMADKVRAEIRAGRTQAMVFTDDERIVPG